MKVLFCGFQHRHIEALYAKVARRPDLTTAGCIEEDEKAAEDVSGRLGIRIDPAGYEDWLKRDIDIVAVGSKFGLRGDAVLKAVQAGKHVIADKPLCTDLKELAAIEDAAKENRVKIGCMLDLRDHPAVLRAEEVLRQGRLGRIRSISFGGQHCIDYANRPSWYFEKGMHGGTINDLAIHGIDLVRRFTGSEFQQIDGIRTWNAYANRHPDFKDCAVFMARLADGTEVMADVSYSAPTQVFSMPTYWEFKLWCERGLIRFSGGRDEHVAVYEEGADAEQILEGLAPAEDYLDRFLRDIQEDTFCETESVIRSTRTALWIQAKANEE